MWEIVPPRSELLRQRRAAYLVSVIPANGLWVDANFKEDQLARMAKGRTAVMIVRRRAPRPRLPPVTSSAWHREPGRCSASSRSENATGNFTKIVQRVPVRVFLDTADDKLPMLRPGLSATVGVDTRSNVR